MKKGILVIDVARCHGCNNCFMACKDEFVGNDFPPYSLAQPRHGQRWMNLKKVERGTYPMIDVAYLPVPCQHCENAPCQQAGGGAVLHRDNGAVLFHTVSARGNRALTDACPYHAVFWNEAEQLPQKCNLCSHLLDNAWDKPRCVQACPTEALTFHWLEPEELDGFMAEQGLEVLHPEYGTRPHVLYRNLSRFQSRFVGGSVTLDGECLEGAVITCRNEIGRLVGTVRSNTFGDFKVDGLDQGEYTITIEYPGCESRLKTVIVKDCSLYLGELPISHPSHSS